MIFVDISKAFDSIQYWAIEDTLKYYGVHSLGNMNIPILAFCDDLVLISEDLNELQNAYESQKWENYQTCGK